MRTVPGGLLTVLVTVSLVSVGTACSGASDDATPTPTAVTTEPATTSPTASATPTTATTSTHRPKPARRSGPTDPVRTVTVDGDKDSYVVRVWTQRHDERCYDHAHGDPVVIYLTTHPCRGLDRLLATTVVGDRTVAIAQSSLSFSGASPGVYRTAGRFRALVESDGTGNLDDLLRDGYRLPSGPTGVPTDYVFSARTQDSAVTVLEAWYLDGTTAPDDPALRQMAGDLFRKF